MSLLCSYLFFLSRRPVSRSNLHYLARRLAGLKSLSEKLDAAGSPDLSAIAKQLKMIQPANFPTLSRALQFQLALTQKPVTIPAHYIVSVRPPRPGLIADAQRLLLILGPAIGIGDEIILFPLPRWIKATRADIEVVVMSGYPGLWERVEGVDDLQLLAHRERHALPTHAVPQGGVVELYLFHLMPFDSRDRGEGLSTRAHGIYRASR